MSENFGRVVTVQVDGRIITSLKITFKVDKSITKDPNKISLELYNLAEESRAQMNKKYVSVIVEAGYTDNTQVLFNGDLRHVSHSHVGPDVVTKIESGDGEAKLRAGRVNVSHKPGADFFVYAKQLIDGMGVAAGNALERLNKKDFKGGLTQFANGICASGSASEAFDKLMRDMGYGWSVQNGQLQILKPGEVTKEKAVLLSPQTGLTASPVHGEKENIKIISLLSPGVKPGRAIYVRPADKTSISGYFRAEKVSHEGDNTHGKWHTTIEASALKSGAAPDTTIDDLFGAA